MNGWKIKESEFWDDLVKVPDPMKIVWLELVRAVQKLWPENSMHRNRIVEKNGPKFLHNNARDW